MDMVLFMTVEQNIRTEFFRLIAPGTLIRVDFPNEGPGRLFGFKIIYAHSRECTQMMQKWWFSVTKICIKQQKLLIVKVSLH
jgi:hypothetical protein